MPDLTVSSAIDSMMDLDNPSSISWIRINANNTATFVSSSTLKADLALTKADVGLGNVENTALSTFAGSSSITTVGTIGTGTWQGTAITDTYISSAATWNAKLSNITGLVTAGTNVTVTGSGTSGSPFVISATGGGGGVTSITGTTNQVNASASTGAVTLSLPQNIHTGAAPTFAGLTSTGNITVTGSVTATASLVAGTSNYLEINGRFRGASATNGNLTLYNGTNTNFGVLQFGGTSTSFPGIARNLASLDMVLADNSAYTNINAAMYTGNVDALSSTPTPGVYLLNRTLATVGVQQVSPCLRLEGRGWKTTSTAASQPVVVQGFVLPIQGTASPTSQLVFQSSINGGAYTDIFKVSSAGVVASGTGNDLTCAGSVFAGTNSALRLTSRSTIRSSADGELEFRNNANSANANITAANGTFSGGLSAAQRSVSASASLTSADFSVFCDATAGAITLTLPAAASNAGKIFYIKKTDASANVVTVDGNASETIDGSTTLAISSQNVCVAIQSDGTNWMAISKYTP